MKIKKLIEAAKEIDDLATKQDVITKEWSQLARDARKPDANREDIESRKRKLDCNVVDFGTAINKLRLALHEE